MNFGINRMKYSMQMLFVAAVLSANASALAQNERVDCEPYSDYIDNRNGTITDQRTNLIWQTCMVGEVWSGERCIGKADNVEIKDATFAALESRVGNRSDWRVPELDEMLSIFDLVSPLMPAKDGVVLERPMRSECKPIRPSTMVMPFFKSANNGMYRLWTSTPMKIPGHHYGVSAMYVLNDFIRVELNTIEHSNSIYSRSMLKLVTSGSPQGHFKSGQFMEIIKPHQEALSKLAQWRKQKRQVGEDTFCGPIIEVRTPMVKIALNAQIQGFHNEAWLKGGDLYPAEYGCRNVNGKLSPLK